MSLALSAAPDPAKDGSLETTGYQRISIYQ